MLLSPEELTRRCAYAVAVVTGVDPWERRHELKGDEDLQVSRRLWVHLLACVFGMNNSEAARMLARRRETIIVNLAEMEDWRCPETHPRGGARFDAAVEAIGGMVRCLMEQGLAAVSAAPNAVERSRMHCRRAAIGAGHGG